jgi:general secretion pathway protein K
MEKEVDRLVAGVLDWRSASGLDLPEAPTRADYERLGYHPRHGAFQSVDELRLVLGITADVFERISPALTVYSRLPEVDQNVAPREVLTALSSMGRDVDAILKSRFPGESVGSQDQGSLRTLSSSIPIAGRTFTITVEAELNSRRSTRTAVILLTADNANPYLVLAWR